MDLETIRQRLDLRLNTPDQSLSREVTGVYASDLLSDVLAHAQEGELWVTLQGHPNIVAVAQMKDLSGIVLVNGRVPEDETLRKAKEEAIPILTTEMPTFQLAGKLYVLLGEE